MFKNHLAVDFCGSVFQVAAFGGLPAVVEVDAIAVEDGAHAVTENECLVSSVWMWNVESAYQFVVFELLVVRENVFQQINAVLGCRNLLSHILALSGIDGGCNVNSHFFSFRIVFTLSIS